MQSGVAKASLMVWNDRVIWTSGQIVAGTTRKPGIVILISPSGDLQVLYQKRPYIGSALVIAQNVQRSIIARSSLFAIILDPIHPLAPFLRNTCFDHSAVVDYSSYLTPALGKQIAQAIHTGDREHCHALSEQVFAALFPDATQAALDPRVLMAVQWLRTQLPHASFLDDLCGHVGVSRSRMTHLFTSQMGVSIKGYLLALRMRKAAELFEQEQSITYIAHHVGFTDSAHLAKAFRRYFSVPPSLLSNPELVRIRTFL